MYQILLVQERHTGCSWEQRIGQHIHKQELPVTAAELTRELITHVWYRYSAYEQLPQIILQSWPRSLEQTGLKSTSCPRYLAGPRQNCICCLLNVHLHSICNYSCSQCTVQSACQQGLGIYVRIHSNSFQAQALRRGKAEGCSCMFCSLHYSCNSVACACDYNEARQ